MAVKTFLAEARKLVAALSAAIAVIVANGLLPDEAAKWASGILASVGALLVYYVPNAPHEDPSLTDSDSSSSSQV